ncbi:class I SAM-dependent methyltransferase [Mesorhizobium sp. CA15]|uniref:class I SAM-dependent methyltransferase n=1 Tax=Mesorhizobium sp. CA15 TaxID=2876641 RepID=UPI001CD0F93A|nr:class I SAM-dependent methyltransferase [Mesorhizobium sp. CA15]MBZ9865447.1 class I SAM-dependent methyltransferase [Mesorhizobium sp. CA15]
MIGNQYFSRIWGSLSGPKRGARDSLSQEAVQLPMVEAGLCLDMEFYRKSYPDLARMTDEQLRDHFLRIGSREGRLGSPLSLRERFLDEMRSSRSILEIGPFCNPQVIGEQVRYFDILDSEQLVARAKQIGYPIKAVPKIHYTSPIGDLSVVSEKFSAVVSCHCIEHQPDLIHHFRQVSGILEDGGKYYIIVPDKRYCFDHFIAESTIADILDACLSRRRTHRLASVIEHRALTVHNDCVRHWRGDHGVELQSSELGKRVRAAIEEHRQADGGYVDVHSWQFTPEGFQRNIQALFELGYSPLRPVSVHATPFNRNEFTAILSK